MSDSKVLSESLIKEHVHNFCNALVGRNLEKLGSLLQDDAVLFWGPYVFKGKERILTWAQELHDLFPFMTFKEKTLVVEGASAKHEFLIAFIASQEQKGWLPCEGMYEFQKDRIRQLKIKVLHGFLAVNRNDVDRVKPHGLTQ
jgi:hypothetical protein